MKGSREINHSQKKGIKGGRRNLEGDLPEGWKWVVKRDPNHWAGGKTDVPGRESGLTALQQCS